MAATERTLGAMQALASRRWGPRAWWHPGGMAWQVATEQDAAAREMRTWGASEPQAWGWAYQPDVLMLLVDPEAPGLATQVLEWFDDVNTGRAPRVDVADGDTAAISALRAAGFTQLSDQPFAVDQRCSATSGTVRLPSGYVLRDATTVSEEVRVNAHREAWLPSALPFAPGHQREVAAGATSGFDATKLRKAQSLWPYDPARDFVITTTDAEPAACCTVWLDDETGAAEIEPLGVVPAHRRRGLARALCHAALDAVARAGGAEVVIRPRGDAAYPAPRAAYAAAGFVTVNRTRTYGRP